MPAPQTKQIKLSADQQKKLAAVDQFDREQAFEVGFAKCAKDLGLNDTEFKQFYEAACEKLAAAK
jgi:hypothetical protein